MTTKNREKQTVFPQTLAMRAQRRYFSWFFFAEILWWFFWNSLKLSAFFSFSDVFYDWKKGILTELTSFFSVISTKFGRWSTNDRKKTSSSLNQAQRFRTTKHTTKHANQTHFSKISWKISLKRPSYFFMIVFLVLMYSGHFFCRATCMQLWAKSEMDWKQTSNSCVKYWQQQQNIWPLGYQQAPRPPLLWGRVQLFAVNDSLNLTRFLCKLNSLVDGSCGYF